MGNHTGEGGGNTDNANTKVDENIAVKKHVVHNPMLFCAEYNSHDDPSLTDQYLFALNQLFVDYDTFHNFVAGNTNSYYTHCGFNTGEALNRCQYWGHHAGCLPQSNSTMNVYIPNCHKFCIDTNIHRQSNTSYTEVPMTPDVGDIVFMACKCHLPCNQVDMSLVHNTSVLCTLDIIVPLDHIHTYQVVFIHDPRGVSSGFYYVYQKSVDIPYFGKCYDEDLGPFQVMDSKVAKVMFCNHNEQVKAKVALDAKSSFQDYKKDLWSHVNHDMGYTQYIESIIDELCRFTDLQDHMHDPQIVDAPFDATDIPPVPHCITAFLGNDTPRPFQVDHDAYIPSKVVGFLSHDNKNFEFIGPDKPPVCIDLVDKCIEIASIIHETGVPNYKMARIPIVSNLNVDAWENLLTAYPDKHLLQYIKFGFPLSISHPNHLTNIKVVNHYSAIQYPDAVAKYIAKEQNFGTILGPVSHINTPHYHCSPLLTRPKDTNDRRVILNLSYPKGQSLNDQVDKLNFDSRQFTLKFPSVDNIVECILQITDPLIFKIDVARAFRNLRVDPVDALKFGLSWHDALYVDAAVAFGWTHGSAAFQVVAYAISYIMASSGCVINAYIDDFIVVAPRSQAKDQFHRLSGLLDTLGLPMNPSKKTPPCKTLTCLGIVVNITDGTLSIAPDKLQSIHQMCCQVATKKFLSKKSYQSLIGKLIYIHKCVAPARSFINRILSLFRSNTHKSRIHLTSDFFRDIQWFLKFLPAFNGVTFFRKSPIPKLESLHLDACLSGLGAIWNHRVYSTPIIPIPDFTLTIVHLEMWNIVIALRMWGHLWRHSSIEILCDNLAVVQVMNTHKTRDPFLSICDRNVWLLVAANDISLQVHHVRGKDNAEADLLSRLHSGATVDPVLLAHLSRSCIWDKVPINMFHLDFNI